MNQQDKEYQELKSLFDLAHENENPPDLSDRIMENIGREAALKEKVRTDLRRAWILTAISAVFVLLTGGSAPVWWPLVSLTFQSSGSAEIIPAFYIFLTMGATLLIGWQIEPLLAYYSSRKFLRNA